MDVIRTDQYALVITQKKEIYDLLLLLSKDNFFELKWVPSQVEAEKLMAFSPPFVLILNDCVHSSSWQDLKEQYPDLPLILCGMHPDTCVLLDMVHRGVMDYFDLQVLSSEYLSEALLRAFMLSSVHQERQLYRKRLEEMLKMDQEAGRRVQQKFFPEHKWLFHDICFDYRIYPSLYLSGDFVDYYPIDDHRVAFYVADVSGHGASSAFVTILLKNYIERLRRRFALKMDEALQSPHQVLSSLNTELYSLGLGKHLAIFSGLIDTQEKKLYYSVAAQYPPPYLILEGGKVILLDEKGGLPIGIFPATSYPLYEQQLTDSFTLVILSDGILEVLDEVGIEAKELALREKVLALKGDLCEIEKLYALDQRDTLPDDITLCVISSG